MWVLMGALHTHTHSGMHKLLNLLKLAADMFLEFLDVLITVVWSISMCCFCVICLLKGVFLFGAIRYL